MLYLGTIPFHPSFTLWIQYQLPMLIISLQTGHLVAQSSIRNRIKDGHAMLGSSRSDMEQCSGMAIDLWLASRHHTHTYRGTLTITMASTVSSTPCVFVGSLSWNCVYGHLVIQSNIVSNLWSTGTGTSSIVSFSSLLWNCSISV